MLVKYFKYANVKYFHNINIALTTAAVAGRFRVSWNAATLQRKSKANIFSQAGFKTTQSLVLLTKCLTLQYRKAQALFTLLPRKYLLQSNKLQDHAHLASSKTST